MRPACARVVVPVVILGVPVADTVFSFFRRVLSGHGFADADRKHMHHRLVEMGHGPRRAVLILYCWTALLSAAALLPLYTKRGGLLLPIAAVALLLMLYVLFHPGVRIVRARRGMIRHPSVTVSDTEGVDEGGALAAVVEIRGRRESS